MKFENKVAIITGSTRGIGRATAELFAKEGAKVIVVGTKEELGESCVNEIKAAGGEAIFCKTDVTSDESLDNLVKTALDAYGKIDILVNNAGVGGTTANMDQITMDEWNTVLATNLTAPFVLPWQQPQLAAEGLLTLLLNMAFLDSPVRCHWIMDVQECV